MTIAILGYGKEGKSVENYFKKQNIDTKVFDNFTEDELKNFNLASYEMVFRSPGVKPFNKNWSSSTKYFFDNYNNKKILFNNFNKKIIFFLHLKKYIL